MMRHFILLTIAFLANVCAFASKAVGGWQTFTQPDGTVLTLALWGDEHFYCYRDRAGFFYRLDSTGCFQVLTENQFLNESQAVAAKRRSPLRLPFQNHQWDPERTYRQLVVLVTFSDCNFSMDNPQAYYQRLFNEQGYKERQGSGCVADYFRDQSGGLFNVQFDVCGPIQVVSRAKSGNGSSTNYGRAVFSEALRRLSAQQPSADYSPYDWDGDGALEQVIFVYAGYAGNQPGLTSYIWPNTGTMTTVTLPDGHTASQYSASGELWSNNALCSIGTICHEYSHSLGLPDLYPTSASVSYGSVVDEWDLMDCGNVSNLGCCPPNYSAVEKMLMGWLTPIELTQDTVITSMKPVAEGGEAYIIHHTENEYYLLENRQWQGWDAALPGQGLLVWHVNYNYILWLNNKVNNTEGRPDCHLISADNMEYSDWYELYRAQGGGNPYQNRANSMNKILMSTAAYPLISDSSGAFNNSLTDTTEPASQMYNNNDKGSILLSKPITDIQRHDDGTISFIFRASNESAIIQLSEKQPSHQTTEIYTLFGHKLPTATDFTNLPKGIYIKNGKKMLIK